MRVRSFVCLALTCAAALTACSLFVDTSDLEGGGSIVSDADASDVSSVDSASSDSSSPLDSGTDAASPFVFSCDATLCDDFDDSGSFQPVWNVSAGPGGAVTIVEKGRSLPNAFESTVVVQSGESHANVSAVFLASVATPHFRLEFDVFLPAESNPTAGEVDLLDVETQGSLPNGYHLYIGDFSNQWRVAEYAQLADGGNIDNANPLVVTPPADTWSHVVFASDGSTATFTIDGVVAGQLSLDPAAAETGVQRTLDIGWTYVDNNTDPLDGLFDDVSMTFLP